MSLELLNTVATLLTVTIVAATAIAALIQLRHLRAGNQISAMLSIGEELSAKPFLDAQFLIRRKLPAALDDPAFRAYLSAFIEGRIGADAPVEQEELRRSVALVANSFEELGILVKKGIVDQDLFLDRYSWVITGAWERLGKVVAISRRLSGSPAIWENFEYLAVISEDWIRNYPSSYPRGLRRMPMEDPWLDAASR